MNRPKLSGPKTGPWPSVAILAFIITYLVAGFLTLDETTRFVPLLVGSVTLLLLLIDMLRPAFARDEVGKPTSVQPGRELKAIGYVAAVVAGIYVFGFLLTIPVYLFTSIAYLGKQPLRTALIVATVASLAIFLLFEVLLAYRLYPGLLFA
ncbi:MAG: tripartite tricarboxylate transporter TctB family protein [Woeseiaceae bacterium]